MRGKLRSLPRTAGMKSNRQTVSAYVDGIAKRCEDLEFYFLSRAPHALILLDSIRVHISMIKGERRLGFQFYSIYDHLLSIASLLESLAIWQDEIERENESL